MPANILLLPCGDPRNVLYTLFCESPNRCTFSLDHICIHFAQFWALATVRKSLDCTCCDYDPGILGVYVFLPSLSISHALISHTLIARNVLLLTMIMDRTAIPTMWNIFHIYLDIDSRSTLVSQSQKLAAYDSVEAWRSSPYATVIKIGTNHTLSELRRHWRLYADFYHPSNLDRSRALQRSMDARLKEEAATAPEDNLTPVRSAGALFLHSQTSSLFSEQHRHYWETGTTFTDEVKLAARRSFTPVPGKDSKSRPTPIQ